jgi:enoyl-CoA hydratase/carnithine racemase
MPEIAMGHITGAGGVASIGRRIGRHRLAWLMLSAGRLDAATAQDWGLVDAIVDDAAACNDGAPA